MSKPFTTPTEKEWKAGTVVEVSRVGWTNHNWSPHNFAYALWFDENDEAHTPVISTRTVKGEKVTFTEKRKGVLADHIAVVPNIRADGVAVKAPTKKK